MPNPRLVLTLFALLPLLSCYALRKSSGGGQTSAPAERTLDASDIALPAGYSIAPVATGLTFPTGVAFDAAGTPHVTEAGYSYGEEFTVARLLAVAPDGQVKVVAESPRGGPWTGVTWHDGAFFVAEGSQLNGGRILRITPAGDATPIVDKLPSLGDHHTNGPVAGPDGLIYFGQGTATNSGVVGPDNAGFGWLHRFPEFHDIPGGDITLTGENFTSDNPLDPAAKSAVTGAFLPFGTASRAGQVIPGELPCTGAVMRVRPEGGGLELVAWGFRNPFGLAFDPDGALFVTDNMYDERGSRPVFGTGDLLWRVAPGLWHGWPDYHGDRLLSEARFKPPGEPAPRPLIKDPPNQPPKPAAILGVHSSSNGFDFSRSERFGHVGEAFIAQFGDQAPNVGKVLAPVGFKVVRVDPESGRVEDFAVNRGRKPGPASLLNNGGLERPVAARFSPDGSALYVVDFGILLQHGKQSIPMKGTGVLWRITRD